MMTLPLHAFPVQRRQASPAPPAQAAPAMDPAQALQQQLQQQAGSAQPSPAPPAGPPAGVGAPPGMSNPMDAQMAAAAAMMARRLGTDHVEVAVAAATETPIARWRRMVRSMGVPLGTPNEIAINALAEAVGAAGIKVAIGGEGADEILGGYEPILRLVEQIANADPGPEVAAATLLESASWVAPAVKATVLVDPWVDVIGHDAALIGEIGSAIDSGGSAGDPRSYLHWLQTVNLPGLLGRLNAACMLASVEARPPFADRRFAEAIARIETTDLFGPEADGTFRTKTALRRGFTDLLPPEILARPKASFPTPFAPWAASMLADPSVSDAIRPLVRPEVSSILEEAPGDHPLQAWPLANLGLWAVETGIGLDPS